MTKALAVLVCSVAFHAHAATFFVTTTADSGPGSLRQAILDANAAPGGTDTIDFNIGTGSQTITLLSPIVVTGPVIINGTTQEGSSAAQPITIAFGTNALRFDAGSAGSQVRALAFTGTGTAIWINTADSIRVAASRITAADIGIRIDSTENVIGGPAAADGNTIGGARIGVLVSGDDNVITSNQLTGNQTAILLEEATNNIVRGNTITANGTGVLVTSAASRNSIRESSIYDNSALGIDLSAGAAADGVTVNDPGDADTGGNALQNHPVLTSASIAGSQVTINGTLTSTPSTMFAIELFASPAADPSGFGEGRQFLGATTVTTSAAGTASFTATFALPPSAGSFFTATAVNTSVVSPEQGSTSEFSNAVAAAAEGAAIPVLDARALALLGALLAFMAVRALR